MNGRDASRLLNGVSVVDRRLLGVGLPLLASSVAILLVPVLARHYLGVEGYAVWALLMTIVVAASLFDLGGAAFVQALGYGVRTTRRLFVNSLVMCWAGALVVTVVALAGSGILPSADRAIAIPPDMPWMVLATGAAAMVRASLTVVMARVQVAGALRLRGQSLVAQAVLQVLATAAALEAGAGPWSLAIGLASSSALVIALVTRTLGRIERGLPVGAPRIGARRFASARTVSAVVAIVSSQADRWILASFAPASFLTDYDLALRFAALPGGVVATLAVGVIAESAAQRDELRRSALVRRATTQAAGAALALSLMGFSVIAAGVWAGLLPLSLTMLTIFAAALVWLGVNSATAPTTAGYIGDGRPQAELLYAVPAAACNLVGWVVASALAEPWLVPATTAVSVSLWSLWFIRRGTHGITASPVVR